MTIRVLVADDHPLVLSGLRTVLGREADFEVVAAVTSGQQALEHSRLLQPDVVVLDVEMPGLSGIEAARHIRSTCPNTRVVILSMHDQPDQVAGALDAGALGYVLKAATPGEVVLAVRTVHAGRRYLGEGVRDIVPRPRTPGPLEGLSRRERDILRRILNGQTNAAAAAELGLSVKTIETYRSRMMRKLGLRNTSELIRFALKHGLGS